MRKTTGTGFITFAGIVALVLFGCSGGEKAAHEGKGGIVKAIAVLHPTQGNTANGVVTFTKVKNGIRVDAYVAGLSPGLHGFHIHEFGDCSAPDGALAGGHFNPGGMPHAGPTAAKHHEGDLGNLEANQEGIARLEWTSPTLSFEGPDSIVGRGLIVHISPDDLATQPTGNSGARVACGAIGVTKE